MNILNCRPTHTLKSQSIITLLDKLKGADDYASAAELNLHEPTRGMGDGNTDR